VFPVRVYGTVRHYKNDENRGRAAIRAPRYNARFTLYCTEPRYDTRFAGRSAPRPKMAATPTFPGPGEAAGLPPSLRAEGRQRPGSGEAGGESDTKECGHCHLVLSAWCSEFPLGAMVWFSIFLCPGPKPGCIYVRSFGISVSLAYFLNCNCRGNHD
jgi:hypothetical protein